jgi:hypothetical protein
VVAGKLRSMGNVESKRPSVHKPLLFLSRCLRPAIGDEVRTGGNLLLVALGDGGTARPAMGVWCWQEKGPACTVGKGVQESGLWQADERPHAHTEMSRWRFFLERE